MTVPRHHVIVVGAGFSGIGAAIRLREEGVRGLVVLEKADRIGGTWRDNTYPGCAVDVPSAVYSFSFAPSPDWSRAYAQQPEIQAYLERTARDFGVMEHVRLATEVTSAAWDGAQQVWRLETTAGPLEANVLIAGAGPLHEPAIPDLPGLDGFEGTTFHSARWDHDHDLSGERVAVVGTGASAIQFVPRIQPHVGRLHLFQRTPPWVIPKLDRRISEREQALYRRFPITQRALREAIYHVSELVQLAQRHPRVMRQVQRLALRHLRRNVPDPELRRVLTPSYVLGCKRILLSNDYYGSLMQPNVEVIPHALREVRARSVIGGDGVERAVDTIIFGTGFHVTDPPVSQRVRGHDGRTLAEVWGGSPQAFLGTVIAGFPNLFLLIGPNLGNGHTSAIVLVEAQLEYIVGALRALERHGLASLDLKPAVQRNYNERVQAALQGTVWNAGGCSSYYLDANGRNATIYPWTTIDLRRRTRRFDLADYETGAGAGAGSGDGAGRSVSDTTPATTAAAAAKR